ncbi:hypothetical protein LDENG_00273530 [Lucifuga dentata]|nr:hypothetical protein LDENG_00273530 [Lucifuga dentata]
MIEEGVSRVRAGERKNGFQSFFSACFWKHKPNYHRDKGESVSNTCTGENVLGKHILFCYLRTPSSSFWVPLIDWRQYIRTKSCYKQQDPVERRVKRLITDQPHLNIIIMATELLQATGGRTEQMEQQMSQTRQMSFSSSSSSSSSAFGSSTSATKLRKVSQGLLRAVDEHSVAQRKISGVMESFNQVQKSPHIPEGESLPDFAEKLRPVTAQEGDSAVFKAKVTGNPQPSVIWERASGHPLSDGAKPFYDNINKQHILKIKKLTLEDADVYKCIASNEHGEAIYSISLIVTENPAMDFKKMLKKRNVEKKEEKKKPPTEEEMLKILAGADKKDYERICAEYGFTDFRGILKKLKEMKKKEEVEMVRVLKPLEDVTAKPDTTAIFDTILELKDPNIRMQWFLGAELLRIQYSHGKYEVKQMGMKHMLCISSVSLGDMGTYALQVGDKHLSARLTVIGKYRTGLKSF